MKAVWKNQLIAESNETIIVENNHYFPPESVDMNLLEQSETVTTCFWKGDASYYSVKMAGKLIKDAAWTYKEPSPEAKEIANYIAFWRGVKVIE